MNTAAFKYEDGVAIDTIKSAFKKRKKGNRFQFKRPGYRSGIAEVEDENPGLPINTRIVDALIRRPAFQAPEIKPRQIIDFDKLQALDIEKFGEKVQLGEKTMKGINKVIGFSTGEALQDIAEIGAQIGNILNNQRKLTNLSEGQYMSLVKTIKTLSVPKSWQDAGLPRRLWHNEQIKQGPNRGLVYLYLLSNLPTGRTIQHPLIREFEDKKTQTSSKISIASLGHLLSSKPNEIILDVERRTLITMKKARALALSGVDNGMVNNTVIK